MKIFSSFVFLLFGTVLFSGCTFWGQNPSSSSTPEGIEGLLSKVPSEYKTTLQFGSCYTKAVENCLQPEVFQKVQEKQSVEDCTQLLSPEAQLLCKNNFYKMQANQKQDPTICENLDTEDAKRLCKQGLIFTLALNKKDTSLCNQLEGGQKSDCIVSVASQLVISTGEKKWCDAIQDAVSKNNCIALLKMKR